MKHFLILASALFVLASCGGGKSGDKKAELEKLKQQQSDLSTKISALEKELSASDSTAGHQKVVAVTNAATGSFSHFIELQAKVDADENVNVSPMMPGTVSKILVKVGDDVRAGQVLAELDHAVASSGLEELKSQLAFANQVFVKQKNLWDQKIGSEIQFLTAKNTKESLEKRLTTMNETIAMSKITSPINGTVDAVDVKIGQAAAPGMPCMRVVNMNSLKIKGEVAESYASKVKKGNHVLVSFPDLKEEVKAEISFVAKVINPISRSFSVEVKLAENKDYHPNMLAVLKIIDYSSDSAIVVPINIIQDGEQEGANYLYTAVMENNVKVARKTNVKLGMAYNGQLEIIEGVKPGDQVITGGYQDLNDGEKIQY